MRADGRSLEPLCALALSSSWWATAICTHMLLWTLLGATTCMDLRLKRAQAPATAAGDAASSASASADANGLYCNICAQSCPAVAPVDNAGMFGTPGRDHVPVANALLGVWRDDAGSVAATTASAAQTFTGMPRPSRCLSPLLPSMSMSKCCSTCIFAMCLQNVIIMPGTCGTLPCILAFIMPRAQHTISRCCPEQQPT